MNGTKWLNKAVFYNIYPQSFRDSNSDGIGDLQGICEKLDYIQGLGINAIWLNPFYVSPFQDGGYDIIDFYQVDKRYGTNQDFSVLCKQAHERKIKVVIDFVIGHTSIECDWFKKSCKAEKNEYSNRYIWTDDWGKMPDENFISGYAPRNGNYRKNFFYCQPALNFGYEQIDDPSWQLPPDHPDCRATKLEMMKIMEFWMALGCDGFRVDMAASVIKNDYPDGRGVIKFWKEIRRMFDAQYPECVLISEWSNPEMSLKAGFHADFLIHFNYAAYTMLFRAESGRNVNQEYLGNSYFNMDGKGDFHDFLKDFWPQYVKTKGLGYISIPSGNHDLPRISFGRTEEELKIVFAFLLTMSGVPFIYYGDEIGMRYQEELPSKEGGYNRTGSRTPMQWDTSENCGFSDAAPEQLYLPVDKQIDRPTVIEQMSHKDSLYQVVKELIAYRKENEALDADADITFLMDVMEENYPLMYLREKGKQRLLVVINPTSQVQSAQFEGKRISLDALDYQIIPVNQ